MAVDKKLSQFLVRKLAGVGTGVVRYDLTLSQQLPLIDNETVQAHWTPGMNLIRADADFGTEAVTVAVACSLQRDGRKPPERSAGRIDHDPHRFEGGDAEERLAVRVTENDPSGRDLAHELDTG